MLCFVSEERGGKKKSINKKSAAIFGKEFSSWCMCLCVCVNNCLLHFCQLILYLKQIPKGIFFKILFYFYLLFYGLVVFISLSKGLLLGSGSLSTSTCPRGAHCGN